MVEVTDGHASQIIPTVKEIAADDVTLIKKDLSADVASDATPRANRNQGMTAGVFDGGTFAIFEMHHVEDSIGVHFIAGGIEG
jgi:hypothetical protein